MIHSKQIKILIADENASVRNTLTLTLAQHVGDIFEAQQALDTLDLFNDKLPNIVFLDSMIGGELDGVTLCQLIKSMRLPHYCFVVLLLPKASQSLIDECEAAGADNYLIKPFTPSQVLDALATFDQKAPVEPSNHHNTPVPEKNNIPLVAYESLNGFDFEALNNLEIMLGSKEKVLSSLQRFIIDFSESIDEIRQAFFAQQHEITQRKLHSLKGTAAIVGANTLSALAADVEAHLLRNENISDKLIDLQYAWQTISHTITTQLPFDSSDV